MNVYDQYDEILTQWNQLREEQERARDEWSDFMKSGKIRSESNVRPEIYSSWKRCRERGQDPFDETQVVLQRESLEAETEKSRRLLDVCRPVLHEVVEQIDCQGYYVDVYGPGLYLLARFGKKVDEDTDKGQLRREIALGTSQKEQDSGTTAVNLAALLRKPYRLVSYDHYNVHYHSLSTLAVPIIDKNQKLIGVIATENLNWPLHRHTISMLVSMKKNIENQYNGSYIGGSGEPLGGAENVGKILDLVEDSIVVVDASGRIIQSNDKANGTICAGWGSPIGFSCETIWGEKNPFMSVLSSRNKVSGREVFMMVNGKPTRFLGTVVPIFNGDEVLQGAVGIFQDMVGGAERKDAKGKKVKMRAHYSFDNLIGEDPDFRQTIRLARKVAALNNNVLIQGESGTGKELFAQAIHNESQYRKGPFVAVNCSAIPQGLLESELFGYEGGSFTGAKKEGHVGKFELAEGGTIFLDEINSMSMDMQAKILRTIQMRTITRVGGTTETAIDTRIIAAANVDLWEMVKSGEFREDLYYRINVISISIPPLRQRRRDIGLLVKYILTNMSNKMSEKLEIDDEAMGIILSYDWPGNVRELENVLERGSIIAKSRGSDCIMAVDVLSYRGMQDLRDVRKAKGNAESAPGFETGDGAELRPWPDTGTDGPVRKEAVEAAGRGECQPESFPMWEPQRAAGPWSDAAENRDWTWTDRPDTAVPGRQNTAVPGCQNTAVPDCPDSGPRLKLAEKELIENAIAENRGNMSAAARQLGIGRNTLYRKIKKYAIDLEG